jgi:YVTN family beta-propeller protein
MKRFWLKTFWALNCMVLCTLSFAAGPGYHVIKKFQLGGEGGWDCLTVDSAARRMYVSRGTHVMIVDIDSGTVAGDIPDTLGVHAIALVPELNRGFISCGKTNTAAIFDIKTQKIIGTVNTGNNPDVILYDPASKKIFTFNGRSNDATVIDPAAGVVVSTIALGGKPEFAAADGTGKIYVNIEDKSEVIELDTQKYLVTKRFSLTPGEEPSGIGLDTEHHRVFSGCHNKMMTVLDTQSGKVIATLPIGTGVDGNGFDPATGLAFSSNGEGTLTVVQASSGTYSVAETVPTQRGARTMALDTVTHTIYLPTAEFSPAPEPTKENPKPRPIPIKGTFAILVVGK